MASFLQNIISLLDSEEEEQNEIDIKNNINKKENNEYNIYDIEENEIKSLYSKVKTKIFEKKINKQINLLSDSEDNENFEEETSEVNIRRRAQRRSIVNPVTCPEILANIYPTRKLILEWIRVNRFERMNKSWEMDRPGKASGNTFLIKCFLSAYD